MRRLFNQLLPILIFAFLLSCEKETTPPDETDSPAGEEQPQEEETPAPEPMEGSEVTFYNQALVDDGYILVNDASANRVYLMDRQAVIHKEWSLSHNIGNDVSLLPTGDLLASLETDRPVMTLGGQGGQLQLIGPDNTIKWSFTYSSDAAELHHDAELLPNGNILAMVWERMPRDLATEAGSKHDMDLVVEGLIEIDPDTDEIVWEWHSWDHFVQDFDPGKKNYGTVAEAPHRIDLNYVSHEAGDIMHANGIAYDEVNDLIYLSVNFFNEVWVIDHSTTTEEAAGSSGGLQGRGGDLVYRFGNPAAYQNSAGTPLFHRNHYPNLYETDKMLIYTNGTSQSTVYDLKLPLSYNLQAGSDNEPEVLWSFTHPDLFSPKVSGAVFTGNGNILITEGDFGIWEVNREGEILWQFHAPGFYWRAYHFAKDDPAIQALGL